MKTQTHKFKKGTQVCWNWGAHKAYGEVSEIFTEKISRTIKGKTVTRNASPDVPAYLLVQENGQEVLKSESELHHL